jgi:hypothetical protein
LKSEIKTNHELRKKKKQVNSDEHSKPELIFKIQNCEILDLSSINKVWFSNYFNVKGWNWEKINLKNYQGEKK